MHSKIVLILALWAVTASCMPTGEMIPDQDADGQFLYSYGYGYPRYAYATAPWAPTYHVPVATGKDKVPASTAKLITQPAVAYAYPGYHFAGYPYPAGFGYAYGYPITA